MENITGNRIKYLRGRTPGRVIAERAGISQAYFSQIELGQRGSSKEVLTKLAAALGTSVAFLLGETDDPRQDFSLFAKRLAECRKRSGLTQDKLDEVIKLSRGTIAGYESDRISPNLIVLRKLADEFNVSIDYFQGTTNDHRPAFSYLDDITERDPTEDDIEAYSLGLCLESPDSDEETDGYFDYDTASAEERARFDKEIDSMIDRERIDKVRAEHKRSNLLRVKVIDLKACCGRGNKYDDFNFQILGTREIIDGELKAFYSESTLLAVRAEGNSMQPEINDGDYVLFKFDPNDWSWGNQVVVCYKDALFVRGIVEGGKGNFPVILRSRRQVEYPDIIVKEGVPFNIVGRVLRILPASRKPTPVI